MTIRHTRRVFLTAATSVAVVLAATACGSPQDTASGGGDAAAPVKVGLVYSQSGPLASYGKQYIEGFKAGLDFATKGTGKVGDRTIEVTEADDAGDPAKAVSAAKDLIGKGTKIIAGSTSSGVALQVAPIAAQNKVLFISGPAATDAVTGANKYTFRSGRQSWQDVVTARSFIGDAGGKKVVVFAQDGAFGDANEAAVKAVIGGAGANVSSVRAPASATEFTPFASQIKAAKPDLLFVAWAGTTAGAMWQTLDQQGVLASTTVVTGLDIRASWPTFGAAGSKISFLSHYFDGASDTEAAKAAKAKVPGGTLDLFHPDGFAAAQMVVRAVQEGGDDVEKMVTALEGWEFEGVKGTMKIRAEDHALLQPMYQAKLSGSGTTFTATAQKSLTGDESAPPVAQMKG
ncbi:MULTISPECIES: substrate-binding domain-containing protein [Micromonospora]|uniref:substrate-binding domain-containing protein n=1 Tax=Micromonospora TaxID=1873 RepID=UPI00140D443A|nr:MULTISPECIES: substrate-binding domain-containing protein [Micromonospora]MBP1785795.1 branched-chain amino acid transport system substrate-binding protein [Micromonospora sp. HB375]MBQ1067992.1 substrate-binding domain-containing protein [Micromonospora sp. D75]MDH6470165.1 branched-chain amino acid transport system substrate-binding protein [Micromonospora sp. H404/HB375]NHO84844.1 ABC transporter substrate-binding protein [Micromonospora sp. CMU55-4]WDP97832.1 substrate-binding domain-co